MQSTSRPHTLFERLYDETGKRASRQLFTSLLVGDNLAPGFTPAKLAAILFAAVIHGFTLLLVILGIYLLSQWPHPFPLFIGGLCLFFAYGVRPQFNKLHRDILDRARYPKLYALADAVAEKLWAHEVDGIVIDHHYNASYLRAGWQQKRILVLGLPLFATLTNEEKIGVVAHELAHDVNGDVSRSLWIGTAINALNRWNVVLQPPFNIEQTTFTAIAGAMMNVLSVIPGSCAYLLSHLSWRDLQRAEYLADRQAASVAGVDVVLQCLHKLYFVNTFIIGKSHAFWGTRDVFTTLDDRLRNLNRLNEDALSRMESGEDMRLDSTHPPTVFRLRLLMANHLPESRLVLSQAFFDALNGELAPLKQKIQARITDLYDASLYL